MKKTVFLFAFISLFTLSVNAQETNNSVEVGDTFIIGEVEQDNYKHIDFPRANFVVKRGGIVNYNLLRGKKVEVTSIQKKKDGTLEATIKLSSGKRFFSSHKYITVAIDKALDSKELISK